MCNDFLLLGIDRFKFVTESRRCYKCLGSHTHNKCKSLKTCKICGNPQNLSLLDKYLEVNLPPLQFVPAPSIQSNMSNYSQPQSTTSTSQLQQSGSSKSSATSDIPKHNFTCQSYDQCVLLATALLHIFNDRLERVTLPAIIDSKVKYNHHN